MNKVILLGRLGADPEVRYTIEGKPVTHMRVATNEVIVRADGEKEVITDWHRVIAFGKLAENCGMYLNKGSRVLIEGKLKTRSFEDKQGVKRTVVEVWAEEISFLDPVKRDTREEVQAEGQGLGLGDEDIPF
ncbi:MAG: single-stranded DNA-binding protein [Nanopusillaceae archaeon]